MARLTEYQLPDGRTFRLSPEDAKKTEGAKPLTKARTPVNKARTPAADKAAPADDETPPAA